MASPGNKIRFDLNAEDIAKETEKLIEESKAIYDKIGSLKPDDISYDSVIKVIVIFFFFHLGKGITR
jgi:thimet oligopeptidase